jgi:hypothetical protein
MSSYRDDTQETAVASSAVWLGLSSVTEELARASTALFFGLLVMHADVAVASDAALDRPGAIIVERASASDAVLDARQVRERLFVLHADAVQVSDTVVERAGSWIVEHATASDVVLAQRQVRTQVEERARAADSAPAFGKVLVVEGAQAHDWAAGTSHARVLVGESVSASDDVVDVRRSQAPAAEQARADSAVLDRLHAVELVHDTVFAEDEVLGQGAAGLAWTSNADNWAMSRHYPLPFLALTVIDGALFGLASDGVYALDTPHMQAAAIRTAPVDVGKGALVHPLQAFLEYELEDGTASMEVTTTQSGTAQTYSYALEPEPANALTNGRFKFGRGLRGRNFSFTLRLNAKRGEVNDLSVVSTPTKRRV